MDRRFETVDDVLDFAMQGEIEASQFYSDLAERVDNPAMKDVFEGFAAEERGHRAKLEAIKRGEITIGAGEGKTPSLQLADYLVDIEPRPDMEYADALVVAMKKEKAAYRLYLDLASEAASEELTDLFLALAAEEAKHKVRFEIEYDDVVLKEN